MLDTFIKNRGETKTILHNNNHNDISKINWDAEYDGDIANVSLDFNTNGKKGHYDIQLNNNDLAEILNIPTVNSPIDKRLLYDFKRNQDRKNMRQYMIEIDNMKKISTPEILRPSPEILIPRQEILTPKINKPDTPFYTHFSSPLPNEELLIPLRIKKTKKTNSLSISKRNKRNKKHHTYKVYRRVKSANSKSSKRTNRYSRKTF
jgi:fibronectin type 3 domain-containing protein